MAGSFVQIGCWRPLYDLLISPLDRTVPLEQVDKIAVAIAKQLHLDVARAADQSFKIDFIAPKCRQCLAPSGSHGFKQTCFILDRAHSPPAAAPTCLEHERIAKSAGDAADLILVVRQWVAGRHDRNSGLHSGTAGTDLVSEKSHGRRLGPDEHQACCGASFRKIRIFREEAIAGVDGIDPRRERDLDDGSCG